MSSLGAIPRPAVLAALATPYDAAGAPDAALLARHGRRLLDAGLDGLVPFGTTGEGPMLTVAERKSVLEALLGEGVPADRLLVGTGSAAPGDIAELAAHATGLGVAGVLVMPPFFFTDVDAAGVEDSIAGVIRAVGDDRLRVVLYHIPQVAGVGVAPTVMHRLAAAFPGTIVGIKDSAGQRDATVRLCEGAGDLRVYVGAEPDVSAALGHGGAGAISGLANLAPGLIRDLVDRPEDSGVQTRVGELVAAFDALPLIPAIKAALAECTGEPSWSRVRPPLRALEPARLETVRRVLAAEETVG
ncbi:MAG: dihydrodipicolinate synthase family protein [Azospirillaceae bacterium]